MTDYDFPMRSRRSLLVAALSVVGALSVNAQSPKRPLLPSDVDDIARLVMLEDHRDFDTTDLSRLLASQHPEVRRRAALAIGRIADKRGYALLRAKPLDADTAVAATEVFAAGQLKDSTTVAWFDSLLANTKLAPTVLAEAATALGKIKTASARDALARFLSSASESPRLNPAIGEALLSIGRCNTRGDLDPILRFGEAKSDEVRWRAAWALFRPRDPAAVSVLMVMAAGDQSPDVRLWAVRALTKPQADSAGKAADAERILLAALRDSDRRVRTEAIRAIGTYSDSAAVAAMTAAKDSPDSWISVSAAEGLARLNPPPPAGGRQGGGGGRDRTPPPPVTRPLSDYKAIVVRWVVPDYNGAPRPTARWETVRGSIEIELYPGDAPLAVDDFVKTMESGTIVGTAFTRVVPDFVAQEETIPGGHRLRDEVSRHGLTRANLAWASAGLDTGTPGYTLANAVQPHNEGDFTALGRVTKGMYVVDRIQLNDKITAARMLTVR
jgi:HEAT repeat protein/cyclophilin family peptidyl-prolyl cis-trans isomerase